MRPVPTVNNSLTINKSNIVTSGRRPAGHADNRIPAEFAPIFRPETRKS